MTKNSTNSPKLERWGIIHGRKGVCLIAFERAPGQIMIPSAEGWTIIGVPYGKEPGQFQKGVIACDTSHQPKVDPMPARASI